MPGAGDLRDRVLFQFRSPDPNGDALGAWADGFTVWAQIIWLRGNLRGSEAVMQQRLEGKQPVIITVRDSSQARQIDPSWRVVNARNDLQVFNITSAAPAKERGFIDILAVMGGATG